MNKMAGLFYTAWLARKINSRFLVKKHCELFLFFALLGAQINHFELKKFETKLFRRKQKCIAKSV